MSDWKSEITEVFDGLENRRVEIHTALYALLQELERENSIRSANLDLVSEYPLTWNVNINVMAFQIKESEVADVQHYEDGPSRTYLRQNGTLNVTEALKELLILKVKK